MGLSSGHEQVKPSELTSWDPAYNPVFLGKVLAITTYTVGGIVYIMDKYDVNLTSWEFWEYH